MKHPNLIATGLLVGPLAAGAMAQFHETHVQQPSLGGSAELGADVSIHDERAIVGAPGADSSEGVALIYDWDPSTETWELLQNISTPGNQAGGGYGEAVAIHWDRVVVGAPWGDSVNGWDGYAVVHEPWSTDPDIYLPRGVLHASDGDDFAEFGSAVAIRGDWVLVGAPSQDTTWVSSTGGAVYAFKRGTGSPPWGPNETAKIYRSSPWPDQRFGVALDMSLDRAIIGSPKGYPADDATGRAYIYSVSGTAWSEEDELAPGEDAGGFGRAVSIYGTWAVVGAPQDESDSSSLTDVGAAFVYEKDDTTGDWELVAKLTSPEEADNQKFGVGVAIDDGRIVVGTAGEVAYVFSRRDLGSGPEWFLSGEVHDEDGAYTGYYGRPVAAGDDHFAVGSRFAKPSATVGGRTYFYRYDHDFAAFCFASEGDCPCGNDDPIAGCENSTGRGAYLYTLGSASLAADDLGLRAIGLPANKTVVGLAGTVTDRSPFDDGLHCVGSTVTIAVKSSGSGGEVTFNPTETIDVVSPSPGDVVYYQAWYYDPAGPCGEGANGTNAVQVHFSY